MKKFILAIAVFLLAGVLSAAQDNKIVIRLVNGKNGHPIRDNSMNIWLGNHDLSLHDADAKGEVILDVSKIEPREIRIDPNMFFDCRSTGGMAPGEKIPYSLEDILSKGIVGENHCGKATSTPTPGVLILFLRPRTLYEKWML